MSQVSRIPLRKEIEERVFEVFFRALAEAKSAKEVKLLLDDLLTPTEKVMLSKRLAIAILLMKEYDYRAIREILKVSPPTISKVANWFKFKGEGYRRVANKLFKEEAWVAFFDEIADLFHAVRRPPSYQGTRAPRKKWRRKTPL